MYEVWAAVHQLQRAAGAFGFSAPELAKRRQTLGASADDGDVLLPHNLLLGGPEL